MKYHARHFVIFLLSWLHYCQGTSVSVITDDGKDTLSGSYCPTTVKLICNVTSLPHLRWTYNTSKNIIVIFHSDSVVRYPIAAFPFYQLTQFNVYKNNMNRTLINASTILTVDLSDLNKQNIEIISCGFSALDKTVPVNISILQPSFPSVSPQVYTAVIVCYESGLVSSVDVSWRKFQQPNCPEYENSQEYLINVTGCGWTWLNHSTCQDTICSSVFSNCTENLSKITLQAKIADIESGQVVFPTSVDYNNRYFRAAVNQSSRCQIHVQCLPMRGDVSIHQMCTIRYTTDPDYGNLSNPITTLVGTAPVSLSLTTPGTMYYFEFSVLMNDTLLIVERIQYTITESGESFQLGAREGVIIAITSVFLGCFTVHTTIMILCHLKFSSDDHTVSRLKKLITNKRIQISITLILLVLFIGCSTLLTTFAIISNDMCFTNQQVPNSLLDALLVISIIGIASILLYWVSVGYTVYKQSTTEGNKTKLQTMSCCDSNLHKNSKSKTHERNIQEENYNTLKHTHSLRPSDRHDIQDEIYGKLEETFEYLPMNVSVYEPLRAGEKSQPVHNVANASYSHIGRQSEPADTHVLCNMQIHNMRDDYDVLDRNEMSLCTSADIHDPCESVYGNLDEASIEPHGDGVYSQLRPGEKSRPVPNMTDSNYSHVDFKEQSPKRQHELKKLD
ncbi:uncharacterized protein LOC135351235 [Halichondria panicea]|uniref:uncharacterized protein LOC135351235 n=1 Tax=Halichondria panicea TaxID=6063 RepID=UPI00312BA50F